MTPAEQSFDEGNDALAVGDLAGAETKYREAVGSNPDYFEAWHALGMILYKQNRYPEAIEAGLRASALNPQDQMLWTSLSLAYMKNGQIPEAEAAAGKAKVLSWGGKVKVD
jgi:tetratricopeptide (TPR) repeat protein